MDPPKINYVSHNSIMVINNHGKIRQLFVPFQAKVIHATPILLKDTLVMVEEVQQHEKYLILYRVARNWWPYYIFRLSVEF